MLSGSSLIFSFSPSAYPCTRAIGVFSSWETLSRNSFRISSIFTLSSMSFCSSLLADFSSEMVCSSWLDILLKLSPSTSISLPALLLYLASKSRSVILRESSVSSEIGLVSFLVTAIIHIPLITIMIIPTKK